MTRSKTKRRLLQSKRRGDIRERNNSGYVGNLRRIYNELCLLVKLMYRRGDEEIVHLPEAIDDRLDNSKLSIDDLVERIYDAIDVISAGIQSGLYDRHILRLELDRLRNTYGIDSENEGRGEEYNGIGS